MNDFATGFLTGFMKDQASKISERKAAANDYFNKQMQLAQQKALTYNTEYKGKMDAHLQVAKQLVGVGVPENTVMAIINQNPDDLSEFYETVQKMQMEGVNMSNPDVYDSLIKVDGQFNPGNENVTSLLQKMYQPLAANAKADPKGFDFNPEGTIWATMLGHNAMENSYDRLKKTEIMPGVSAFDVLSQPEDGMPVNMHPLGSNSVTLNAYDAGNLTRQAERDQKGVSPLTISEKNGIMSTFEDFAKEERINGTAEGEMVDDATARAAAAARTISMHPEAATLPEVTKWLGGADPVGASAPVPAPITNAAPTEQAPTAPVGAPTAPSASQASPTPVTQGQAPEKLPDGSTKVKEFSDGTVGYITSTGVKKRYTKAFLENIMRGQDIMNQNIPDWNRPLGG